MLLTPLGILAAGTAWGEWSAQDFSNPEMRQKIAAASGNVAPPAEQPRGLGSGFLLCGARPFRNMRRPFVRRPAFGYVMSAMFGSGLILGFFLLMGWLFGQAEIRCRQRLTMSAEVARSGRTQPGSLLLTLWNTLSTPKNWRRKTACCKVSTLGSRLWRSCRSS